MLTVSVLWTLLLLAATVAVTPVLDRLMGRAACWVLAALYLAAAAALLPAAAAVMAGGACLLYTSDAADDCSIV